MNIADIILIIVIILAFSAAVSCIVKNMKKGKCCSGCGGACSGCRYSQTERENRSMLLPADRRRVQWKAHS